MKIQPPHMRARLALEAAAQVTVQTPLSEANILLRNAESGGTQVVLSSASTTKGIDAVAAGEATMAIVNPSAALTLAYRGSGGPYRSPQPVRTVSVMPSFDQCVLVVRPETGLKTLEEIAQYRGSLKIGVRRQDEHSLRFIIKDIAAAAGFDIDALAARGGGIRPMGSIPYPDTPKFKALIAGELDAVFDEGVQQWLNQALDAGMVALPMAESTLRTLEAAGYRRGRLARSQFPRLPQDVLTVDFSGWAVFVHADTPDDVVRAICAGIDERRDLIPWDGDGPYPVERACQNTEDAPYDVPLHPAAERYWKERGYLK